MTTMPPRLPRLGIDLGGTKIELLAMRDDGSELFRERIATLRAYDASLDALARLIARSERRLGLPPSARAPVGVSMPGALSLETGLSRTPTRPG